MAYLYFVELDLLLPHSCLFLRLSRIVLFDRTVVL